MHSTNRIAIFLSIFFVSTMSIAGYCIIFNKSISETNTLDNQSTDRLRPRDEISGEYTDIPKVNPTGTTDGGVNLPSVSNKDKLSIMARMNDVAEKEMIREIMLFNLNNPNDDGISFLLGLYTVATKQKIKDAILITVLNSSNDVPRILTKTDLSQDDKTKISNNISLILNK